MKSKRWLASALLTGPTLYCFSPAVAIASDEEESWREEFRAEEDSVLQDELQRQPAKGILPQLFVLLRLPEGVRLYNPDKPNPPAEPLEYNRRFPFGGEKAINRGYALPRPYGMSAIYITNLQDQTLTDSRLSFGKGVVPPVDVALRPFPALAIDSESDTESLQIKGDVWLLPGFNAYLTLGKVTGDASLTVNINLADAPQICIPDPRPTLPGQPPRPPICSDNDQSGSFLLPILASVDRNTVTFGLNGAFGIDKWFAALNAAYTDSFSEEASDVTTINAGVRAGRRFFMGSGHALTPYVGINYIDIDTRVQGVATLRDAFPDGDELNVRYDIKLDNTDKYSGIAGLSFGFTNGMGVQLEWNKSDNSDRFVLSAGMRF